MYNYLYRFYDPNLQRWMNRDPINEPGFNLLIRRQRAFSLDEEKNLYTFVHNGPMNLVDADGRVPALLIFTTGKAIANGILACYDCYQLSKCVERSRATAQQAAARFTDAEAYLTWLNAAKPGAECTELLAACGKDVLFVAVWAGGRYFLLKYYAGGRY